MRSSPSTHDKFQNVVCLSLHASFREGLRRGIWHPDLTVQILQASVLLETLRLQQQAPAAPPFMVPLQVILNAGSFPRGRVAVEALLLQHPGTLRACMHVMYAAPYVNGAVLVC